MGAQKFGVRGGATNRVLRMFSSRENQMNIMNRTLWLNALEEKQIGNLIKIGNCMFWYLVEVTGRQHDSLLMTRALLNSIDLGQPELCQACEQTRLDHRIFMFKWIHSMKPQHALDGAYSWFFSSWCKNDMVSSNII